MLLNRLEYALMNNPIRAVLQRHVEVRYLRRLGGIMDGGLALEVGCGRGIGAEIILDVLGADRVHCFDLDARMVRVAQGRLASRVQRAQVWVGDAAAIALPDTSYDAVVAFGVLHHLPKWRAGVAELFRVLKPGGRLYAEEVLAPLIRRTRHFLTHPQHDRFDAAGFQAALTEAGFGSIRAKVIGRSIGWFAATRPGAASAPTQHAAA